MQFLIIINLRDPGLGSQNGTTKIEADAARECEILPKGPRRCQIFSAVASLDAARDCPMLPDAVTCFQSLATQVYSLDSVYGVFVYM